MEIFKKDINSIIKQLTDTNEKLINNGFDETETDVKKLTPVEAFNKGVGKGMLFQNAFLINELTMFVSKHFKELEEKKVQ